MAHAQWSAIGRSGGARSPSTRDRTAIAETVALSRYEVQNELHYVESIHNAAIMKPTAS